MKISTNEEYLECFIEYAELCSKLSLDSDERERYHELYDALKEYRRVNDNPLSGG